MTDLISRTVLVPEHVPMIRILGTTDDVLRTLERGLAPAHIHVRDHEITLSGPENSVELADSLLNELVDVAQGGEHLTCEAVERALSILKAGVVRPTELMTTDVLSLGGRTIRPKTLGQKAYVDAIDTHDITVGIGPAGTGKTYLAVAKAVVALHKRDVSRIILTRPAVEAGESLGFLPGSLTEKIDPYVRPLYDAMFDMIDQDAVPKLLDSGTIEVAPLAYMRGRTLNDAFVILDEAQNTTPEQMKMFLTRLGFGTKMVITGDLTQIDLPGKHTSGLLRARSILRDIPGIAFLELGSADVVRHRLVADIIDAYARADAEELAHGRSGATSPTRGHARGKFSENSASSAQPTLRRNS